MITFILLCFLRLVIINDQLLVNVAHVEVVSVLLVLLAALVTDYLYPVVLVLGGVEIVEVFALGFVDLLRALEVANAQASKRGFRREDIPNREFLLFCPRLCLGTAIELSIEGSLLAQV